MLGFQAGQQIEHIFRDKIHLLRQAVSFGVFARHFNGRGADVHRRHMLRAALCRIQRKGAGMRKAIQHALAPGQLGHGQAVVFLV